MGTISVPSRTLCPTVEIANGDFLLFDRKRLGPKELLWKQHLGCHFVSFVMYIYAAKFQEHCFNIPRDIVYSAECGGRTFNAFSGNGLNSVLKFPPTLFGRVLLRNRTALN